MPLMAAHLLEQLEPLRKQLHAGSNAVLPVVGSGLSRGLLSWTDLLKKLIAHVDAPDVVADLLRELEREKYLDVAQELERVLHGARVSAAIKEAYQRPKSP